ncbi:hypothetical protein ACRUZW_26005 [Mycobacterium colombiense]
MAQNVQPTAAQDAATQARAGEAKVIGNDQDRSATGAADAASGEDMLKANVANTPAAGPQFTTD